MAGIAPKPREASRPDAASHIVFRSRSGGNARDNRVAICAAHHQHGLHGGGYVRAWGEAPDAIHWELGVRPQARPLLTLIGDRYVSDN